MPALIAIPDTVDFELESIFGQYGFVTQRAGRERAGLLLPYGKRIIGTDDDMVDTDRIGQERQRCRIVDNRVVPELASQFRRQLRHLALQAERPAEIHSRQYP